MQQHLLRWLRQLRALPARLSSHHMRGRVMLRVSGQSGLPPKAGVLYNFGKECICCGEFPVSSHCATSHKAPLKQEPRLRCEPPRLHGPQALLTLHISHTLPEYLLRRFFCFADRAGVTYTFFVAPTTATASVTLRGTVRAGSKL